MLQWLFISMDGVYAKNAGAIFCPLQIDETTKWDGSSASSMGLKMLYAALLILIRDIPLSAIKALPKIFLIPLKRAD